MELFDRLFGKSTYFGKGGRKKGSKNRNPKEKLDALEASYLRQLKSKDPVRFDRVMSKKLGYGDEAEGDPFSTFESQYGRVLKIAEMVGRDSPGRGGLEGILKAMAPAIGESIGPQLGEIMQRTLGGQQTSQAAFQQVADVLRQMQERIISLEAQLNVQSPTLPAQSGQPALKQPQEQSDSGESNVGLFDGMMVSIIIGNLQNKTPEQAAFWLLQQATSYPQAAPFVQVLCETPDEQLPAMLSSASQRFPQFAGVINWLRQRPEWLVQTVNAIRRQAGQASVSNL